MAESEHPRHAVIFVNGDCDANTLSALPLTNNSLLVAVDGGLRYVKAIDRVPDYLIGDMDSVDADDHAELSQNQHTRVILHPRQKDSTDLELALDFVTTLQVSSILLVGVTGGKLDQALANILLLGAREWPFSIDILSAEGQASLLTPERTFSAALVQGTELSLLPLSQEVTGVTTEGLYYPLHNAQLNFGSSLGISNVVNAGTTSVSLEQGKLLLVIPLPQEIN